MPTKGHIRNWKTALCCLLFLWLSGLCMGQGYAGKHLTVNDGLPSSFVYRAIQDSQGFMWFLTDKGVARYDGHKFRVFTVADGLPSNDVWDGCAGADQSIWLATFASEPIGIRDGKVIQNGWQNRNQKGQPVTFLAPTDSAIYFLQSRNKSVQKLQNGKVCSVKFSVPSEEIYFTRIFQMGDGTVSAIGTRQSPEESIGNLLVFSLAGNKAVKVMEINHSTIETDISRTYQPKFQASKSSVRFFNLNQADSLAFLSEGKIFLFHPNGIRKVPQSYYPVIDPNQLHHLLKFQGNFLVQGPQDCFVTDQQFKHLPAYDFLNQYNINTVFQDDHGNLWVCTQDDGVFFFAHNFDRAIVYDFGDLNQSNHIEKMALGPNGTLLVGLGNGQMSVVHKGKAYRAPTLFFESMDSHTYIKLLSYHPIWGFIIGDNRSNYYRFQVDSLTGMPKNFSPWTFPKKYGPNDAPKSTSVKEVHFRDSTMIISMRGGVRTINMTSDSIYRNTYKLSETVHSSDIAPNEGLWMATKSGLYCFPPDDSYFEQMKVVRDLQLPINHLRFDSNKNLLLGTDGLGLFLANPDTLIQFKEIKNWIVSALELDIDEDRNAILVGSNHGVGVIYTYADLSYDFKLINTTHGLPSNEVSSILSAPDRLYIGTHNGLSITYYPKLDDTLVYRPRLYINSIKIEGQLASQKANYDLSYLENDIEVDFTGLSFESGEQMGFQYRILQLDSNWRGLEQPHINLVSLASGKYTVEIKMTDILGASSNIESLNFFIHPPFWNRWGFRIILFVVGLCLVAVFIRYRTRKTRLQLELEAEVNKKIGELELQALRAQMNPHFIFNVLNSFQRIIIQEDFLLANEYLGKLARLMRLSLEASRQRSIALDEELQVLRLYVELEQLRFKDQFDFELWVDPKINIPEISLPPMLIQPMVENAINHGVSHLKSKGKIHLRFEALPEGLLITVDDNGIGIEAARKLYAKINRAHRSQGMEIILEKIDILDQIDDFRVSLDIQDKKKLSMGQGTLVTITIQS